MRSLEQLEEEAALRHTNPEHTHFDPVCHALSGADAYVRVGGLPRAAVAWADARDRWGDRLIRRHVLPGYAQVMVVGAGFDPRFFRLPKGLLGEGRVVLVDRAEVLNLRRQRLTLHGFQDPSQVITAAHDLNRWDHLGDALASHMNDSDAPWLVLIVGMAPHWGMEGLRGMLSRLVRKGMSVGLDWLGPGQQALDASERHAFHTRYGEPFEFQPLGLELWLKALGAEAAETTVLLKQ
ncbi:MAG: class I SAM-dependent methyltransferase, partial [Myxococcota bacterium]